MQRFQRWPGLAWSDSQGALPRPWAVLWNAFGVKALGGGSQGALPRPWAVLWNAFGVKAPGGAGFTGTLSRWRWIMPNDSQPPDLPPPPEHPKRKWLSLYNEALWTPICTMERTW